MNHKNYFIGKWAWYKTDKNDRYIEFVNGKQGMETKVYLENTLWEDFKKLNLVIERDGEGNPQGYIFHNEWLSPDSKKFFSFESSTRKEAANFVNAMEFEVINENKLKQLLMGYRFDETKNKWVHFKQKVYLNRIIE